jgi:hypothetical protein
MREKRFVEERVSRRVSERVATPQGSLHRAHAVGETSQRTVLVVGEGLFQCCRLEYEAKRRELLYIRDAGFEDERSTLGNDVDQALQLESVKASRMGVRLTPRANALSGSAWPNFNSALTMAARRRSSTINASDFGCSIVSR